MLSVNPDRKLQAGRLLAVENVASVASGNSKAVNKIADAYGGGSGGAHGRKFGYFELSVKGKVRKCHNDHHGAVLHNSNMAKRLKKIRDPGWFVREWLAFKGLRQKDLVARTDWNKSQVNEWVNGRERWNRDVLLGFAYAIGVDPADLLRPPPTDPVDDEFSRFAATLDHQQKQRVLRLWHAATGNEKAA